MKFTCSRSALASVLNMVNNIVPTRTFRAVLQNVCLQGNNNNTLTISGTDLEIGMSVVLPVDELSEPKNVLINSNQLTGILSEEKSEKVFFDITKDVAKMTTDHGYFEFSISSEEFPQIKKLEDENYISISGEDLKDAVERTKFAVSQDDQKYTFRGICVNFEKDNIDFVGCDGSRMSLVNKKINNPQGLNNLSIVVYKGMVELARMAQGEDRVNIQFSDTEMIASVGNVSLVSRLLEGKFPQYHAVIPKETTIKLKVKKQELLNGLRLINKISTEESHGVRLDGANNKLTMSINGGNGNSGRYEIDSVVEGGELATSYNCLYLLDGINSMKNEDICLDFIQNGKPVVLKEEDYIYILPPMIK